jgi:anaerobic magnesium-protoporphyrin IX monomethyl ester cyclase
MKKILLINPGHEAKADFNRHTSYREVHRDVPPLAVLYLASYLIEHNYDVHIIDTHIEDDYLGSIKEHLDHNDYLYIGISVIIGKFLKNANELTQFIKSLKPNLPIVWGGIMASNSPEEILTEYGTDYVARFDGEEIVLGLAKVLEKKKQIGSVNGLSYVKDGKIVHNKPNIPYQDLDKYPIAKWDILGKHFNKRQIPYYYSIMTSRGCIYNCSFCYKHSVDADIREEMPVWRFRSAEHIIKELSYIHKKTGTTVFTFGDDNFFVNKKRVIEVLEYCKKLGFYIEECIGHINNLDDNLIDAMGGVVQTFMFSVESASPRLQKFINKKVAVDKVAGKVEKLHKNGIVVKINFIVGLPTEKRQDLRTTAEFMMNIKSVSPFAKGIAYLYFPLPKTNLYREVEKIYSIKLPSRIRDYEDANFWVRSAEDFNSKKFRPWISDEDFSLLVLYAMVFNDVFDMCNLELKKETKKILENNSDIRELFKGIEHINHPKELYQPYVLDKVLKGEKIDLLNGLRGR